SRRIHFAMITRSSPSRSATVSARPYIFSLPSSDRMQRVPTPIFSRAAGTDNAGARERLVLIAADKVFSLSSSGGEGWGKEAVSLTLAARFEDGEAARVPCSVFRVSWSATRPASV